MLHNFVTVFVPGTRGTRGPLTSKDRRAYVDATARQLSAAFGGATAQPGIGFWVASDGALVRENVTLVTSFHDRPAEEAIATARGIATWLKNELAQEAVTIQTEEGLEFI